MSDARGVPLLKAFWDGLRQPSPLACTISLAMLGLVFALGPGTLAWAMTVTPGVERLPFGSYGLVRAKGPRRMAIPKVVILGTSLTHEALWDEEAVAQAVGEAGGGVVEVIDLTVPGNDFWGALAMGKEVSTWPELKLVVLGNSLRAMLHPPVHDRTAERTSALLGASMDYAGPVHRSNYFMDNSEVIYVWLKAALVQGACRLPWAGRVLRPLVPPLQKRHGHLGERLPAEGDLANAQAVATDAPAFEANARGNLDLLTRLAASITQDRHLPLVVLEPPLNPRILKREGMAALHARYQRTTAAWVQAHGLATVDLKAVLAPGADVFYDENGHLNNEPQMRANARFLGQELARLLHPDPRREP